MTKKQLIEKLSTIDDDTEIMIWNGIVEDCIPLGDLANLTMVKRSKESCYRDMLMDLCKIKKDFNYKPTKEWIKKSKRRAKEIVAKEQYSMPNMFMEQDMLDKYYPDQIEVIILEAELANKTYQDRLGSIEY